MPVRPVRRACDLVRWGVRARLARTMSEAWPDVAGPGNRDAILTAAAALAGADGRDGLSPSALAMALGRSWGGPEQARSRQELQLAVMTEAGRIFDEEVIQPARAAPA